MSDIDRVVGSAASDTVALLDNSLVEVSSVESVIGSTGLPSAVAQVPRARRMPLVLRMACKGVFPTSTITSGSTKAI